MRIDPSRARIRSGLVEPRSSDDDVTNVVRARLVLERLRATLAAATRSLASSCSRDGSIDARRFDEHQPTAYELAWASAELLAAETAVQSLDATTGPLENALALLFAVEAGTAIIMRLETLFIEFVDVDVGGPGLETLRRIASSVEWTTLRRNAGGEAALVRAAGRLLVDASGRIADIPLAAPFEIARDTFRRFARVVVEPLAQQIHRQDLTVPESLLGPLRDMGVFGLSIPERFGGTAPDDHDDMAMMLVVTEALSEASLGAAGSLITRPEILSRALLTGGTDEQKSSWLPRIAAGEPLCAIAITEPDVGSDVAAVALRAREVEGGWRLDGAKTWCTFAGKAGLLMVVARTDPDASPAYKGLSVFLVEKPSYDGHEFSHRTAEGGSLVGKAIPTIGYRGMHSFDLAFDDFFVPAANLVGGRPGLGKGFYFTMAGLVNGRMQTAARASGVMQAALRAAFAYSGDRMVFGAPLVQFSLTLAKLARMAARFSACRLLTYRIAALLEHGDGRMEASLVKLLACRSAEMITREALQIHGAMGYAEESAVSRHFVDARVLSIFEGAEETLALKVVARSLLERSLTETDHEA